MDQGSRHPSSSAATATGSDSQTRRWYSIAFGMARSGACDHRKCRKSYARLWSAIACWRIPTTTYGDMFNDYSARDKQEAIEALRFDDLIDYQALKANAPTLINLNRAMTRNERRKAAA